MQACARLVLAKVLVAVMKAGMRAQIHHLGARQRRIERVQLPLDLKAL
jgi:hypothetical protein